MTSATDAREFRPLPLALIDRPELDARIERSPDFLDALTHDIARRGVLVPLIVVQIADRYEVVDGFTRYIAAMRAGLMTVPCTIYPTKDLALEGVKYSATQLHENFTPADEAIYFKQLLDNECGGDIEQVCTLVNKKLSYVDSRLALVLGDAQVFEAVKDKKITLGVAAELNKLDADDWRAFYLSHAIKAGATVGVVASWVAEWRAMYENRGDVPQPAAAPSAMSASQPLDIHYCEICRKSDPRFIPEQINVHTHCKLAVLAPLLDSYHGGNS